MSDFLDAALQYQAHGLAVVPLYPRTKKPCNPRNPQGREWEALQGKPLSADEIKVAWAKEPNANVGVLLAGACGIDVLDLDIRNFDKGRPTPPEIKALVSSPEKLGVPYNLTGGGGVQFFFRRAENLIGQLSDTTSVYPGVEFYAAKAHNFVFPPSIHPDTGKAYSEGLELVPDRLSDTLADRLPSLATAMYEALRHRRGRTEAAKAVTHNGLVERLAEALTSHWPVQASHRHGLSLAFGGWAAKHGVPKAHALTVVERIGRRRSDDEIPDRLQAVEDSYERHARGEDVKGASALPPEVTRDLQNAVRYVNGSPTGSLVKKTVEIISADELLKLNLPDPRWAVPGILGQGVTILAGKPKTGKSWLALATSIAVAAGGVVLGKIRVEKGEVLHLALEDTKRRLQDRLRRLIPNGEAPTGLQLTTWWPRLDQGGLEEIEKWLNNHPLARLIVVDTIERLRAPRSRNGNSYAEDYAAVANLKGVGDAHNASSLLLHHLRKCDAEDPFDRISGTLGLTGAADGAIVLKRARGESDATLHVTGRDVEEKELALKWTWPEAMWTILGDAEDYSKSKERQAIVNVLREAGKPLFPKEVAAALDKKGNAVKVLIWTMARDGEVKALGDGRYTINPTDPPYGTDFDNPANRHGGVSGVSGYSREPGEEG